MSSNPPGFQEGNEWGKKAKLVSSAIKRSIIQDDGVRLRNGVERLMDSFSEGEPWALQMVMDRLEGKAAQSVTVSGDDDAPLVSLIKMVVVQANASNINELATLQGETVKEIPSQKTVDSLPTPSPLVGQLSEVG